MSTTMAKALERALKAAGFSCVREDARINVLLRTEHYVNGEGDQALPFSIHCHESGALVQAPHVIQATPEGITMGSLHVGSDDQSRQLFLMGLMVLQADEWGIRFMLDATDGEIRAEVCVHSGDEALSVDQVGWAMGCIYRSLESLTATHAS